MIQRLVVAAAVAFIMVSPMALSFAAADGMTYFGVYDDWNLSAEETQYGLINHVNGLERLLLAVRLDEEELSTADQAFWIVAIPGDPGDIDIGLMPSMRELDGVPYADRAVKELSVGLLIGYGTQLYPLLALPLLAVDYMDSASDDVDVYDHLDADGITMEVVSAQYASALDEYLQDQNLDLDDGSHQVIDEYIGEDFSFVLSWVSNVSLFMESSLPQEEYDEITDSVYFEFGLFVMFPTEQVYYPMRLTSVYGETVVPMLLQVIGHVEPDGSEFDYGPLGMSVEHMFEGYYPVLPALTPLFTPSGDEGDTMRLRDLKYTQIVIKAPSEELTADLWMVPASSAELDIQSWVIGNAFLAALLIIIGLSAGIGVVAGAIVFVGHKPVLWKFALLGLANFTTIVGLWLISKKLQIERTMTRSEAQLPAARYRARFLVVYSIGIVVSLTLILRALYG